MLDLESNNASNAHNQFFLGELFVTPENISVHVIRSSERLHDLGADDTLMMQDDITETVK